jgi:hypothetical protein
MTRKERFHLRLSAADRLALCRLAHHHRPQTRAALKAGPPALSSSTNLFCPRKLIPLPAVANSHLRLVAAPIGRFSFR